MPLLIFIVLLFVMFGWSLPPSTWGVIPVIVGVLMLLGGLMGIVGSFRQSGATAGLGSVLFAFLGVVIVIFGLGMAGRDDLAESLLGWLRNVDDRTAIVGGLVIGVILAGFAKRDS